MNSCEAKPVKTWKIKVTTVSDKEDLKQRGFSHMVKVYSKREIDFLKFMLLIRTLKHVTKLNMH